ncbi:MAG: nuclear transport factor 2 family protein [Acidimicrobiales bacterium]
MSEVGVEDTLAVYSLYARYARAIDSGDGDAWASCYAEDGVYSSSTFGECQGRDRLKLFAADHFDRWIKQGVQTRHWNNQVLLTPSATGIDGSVYVLLLGVRKGEAPRPLLQTVYTDALINVEGRWQLAQRRSDADMLPDPSQLGFTKWSDSD